MSDETFYKGDPNLRIERGRIEERNKLLEAACAKSPKKQPKSRGIRTAQARVEVSEPDEQDTEPTPARRESKPAKAEDAAIDSPKADSSVVFVLDAVIGQFRVSYSAADVVIGETFLSFVINPEQVQLAVPFGSKLTVEIEATSYPCTGVDVEIPTKFKGWKQLVLLRREEQAADVEN